MYKYYSIITGDLLGEVQVDNKGLTDEIIQEEALKVLKDSGKDVVLVSINI